MEYNFYPYVDNNGTYIYEGDFIYGKKCVNNIKNENNYCFIYCFMLHVYNELLI